MNIAPEALWAMLSPTLRRQIVDDVAVVLAEVFREIGIGQADTPGAQSGRLHPSVNTPPSRQQSRESALAIRASAARPRARMA